MRPVEPIVPGKQLPVTLYAKDQPEYNRLPVYRESDGAVLSRWKLSLRERLRVVVFGDVYLWVLTFGRPLQPVSLQAEPPLILSKDDIDEPILA